MREPTGESALDLAMKRLDRAVAALEQRLSSKGADGGGLFDEDRGRLAVELERARERERELAAAGAEASAALGRAIAEIKSALAEHPTEALEAAAAALAPAAEREEV